jgi:hypothetical protein
VLISHDLLGGVTIQTMPLNTKYTTSLMNLIFDNKVNRTVTKLWGAHEPVIMGDGIKFRVTRSRTVNYIYIRYKSGFDIYDIEFAALNGTEYKPLLVIEDIPGSELMKTISRKLFGFDAPGKPEIAAEGAPKVILQPAIV